MHSAVVVNNSVLSSTPHVPDQPEATRRAYFADYKRKERLAKALPQAQLILRTKAILAADFREYGPRLAKLLGKWEVETRS